MFNTLMTRLSAPAAPIAAPEGARPKAPAAPAKAEKPAKKESPFGKDVLLFGKRDADKNGYLTSDEYGVGKAKQADFFRYDANHDGKLTYKEASVGVVTDAYATYLGRKPDAQGLKDYVAKLKNGATPEAIAAEIAASPEAQRYAEQTGSTTSETSGTGDAAIVPTGNAPATDGTEGASGTTATAEPTDAPEGQGGQAGHYISQYNPDGNDQAYFDATAVWNDYRGEMQAGFAQCGATSSAMAMRAFGFGEGLSDAELIVKMGGIVGTDKVNGTGPYAMYEGLNAMDGYQADIRGPGADVEWIKQQLQAGNQVIANGDYYAMPPHQNDASIGAGPHYVSVYGYDEATDTYLVNDPAWDNGGEPIRLSGDQLAYFINSNQSNGGFQISVGPEA